MPRATAVPCAGGLPVRLSSFYRTVLASNALLGSALDARAEHTSQPVHTNDSLGGDAGDGLVTATHSIPGAVAAIPQQASDSAAAVIDASQPRQSADARLPAPAPARPAVNRGALRRLRLGAVGTEKAEHGLAVATQGDVQEHVGGVVDGDGTEGLRAELCVDEGGVEKGGGADTCSKKGEENEEPGECEREKAVHNASSVVQAVENTADKLGSSCEIGVSDDDEHGLVLAKELEQSSACEEIASTTLTRCTSLERAGEAIDEQAGGEMGRPLRDTCEDVERVSTTELCGDVDQRGEDAVETVHMQQDKGSARDTREEHALKHLREPCLPLHTDSPAGMHLCASECWAQCAVNECMCATQLGVRNALVLVRDILVCVAT